MKGFASDFELNALIKKTTPVLSSPILFSDLPAFYSVETEDEAALRDISYPRLLLLNFDDILNRAEPKNVSHSEIMMAMTEFQLNTIEGGNKLLIELDYLSDSEILIRNMNGKLLSKLVVGDPNRVMIEVDITNFPTGDYTANDGNTTLRFSKK